MKKFFIVLVIINCQLSNVHSQNIGIGTTTPGSKLQVAGSFAPNYTSVTTSPYNIGANDYYVVYNGGFGAGTFKLPAGTAAMKGRNYFIKNGAGNPLTIKASGTETIDGDSALILNPGEVAHFIMKGTTGSGNATSEIVSVTEGSYSFFSAGLRGRPWSTHGNTGTTPANNYIGTNDQQDFVTATYGVERMRVTSDGNVGIGTNNPFYSKLRVNGDAIPSTASDVVLVTGEDQNTAAISYTGLHLTHQLLSAGSASIYGIKSEPFFGGAGNQTGDITGIQSQPFIANGISGGTFNNVYGGVFEPFTLSGSPHIASAYGVKASNFIGSGGGQIDNSYSFFATASSNAGGAAPGFINNHYGLYVQAPAGANFGHKYAIVTEFSAGNVGIGLVPNPAYMLEVDGDINAFGSVRSFGTALTSDARLKKNISTVSNALASVMQLRPVTYLKKATLTSHDYSRNEIGFVAQDVRKVFPQLVYEGKDNDKVLAVDYNSLIPVLTKAIQEQQAEIKKQKATMKQQQAEIKALKNSLASYASLAQQVKELQELAVLSNRSKESKLAKN